MNLHRLEREQVLPAALEKAWEFFSNPRNLDALTPDDPAIFGPDPPQDILHFLFQPRKALGKALAISNRSPYSKLMKRLAFVSLMLGFAVPLASAQEGPLGSMKTKWAAEVSEETPWPEYPRPQLVRENWTNLNGKWDYAITAKDAPHPEAWDGKILVPFCVESQLSGVQKTVGAEKRLWYRRSFANPGTKADRRLMLNFEAVDWHAQVFVNGKQVGEHKGGYDPFSFDIAGALTDAGEQEIVVSVWDPTDAGSQPRGKQIGNPHGIWYTAVTGIWGTVWLEEVPWLQVAGLEVHGVIGEGTAEITGEFTNSHPGIGGRSRPPLSGTYRILDGDTVIASGPLDTYELPRAVDPRRDRFFSGSARIREPKLWSPDSPHLYRIIVEFKDLETVESYFAFREVGWGKDKHGVNRLYLNGEPVFHYGPLDQGWWPDGLYTAPTDEALKYDIEMTKAMGFNMARKHVKVEPRRWYYWADKLGLMVWQDMPSGFRTDANQTVGSGAREDVRMPDEVAAQFLSEWEEIMDDFGTHPSIVAWIPFNEGWGQHRTNEVLKWTKEKDPSRLVGGPSGWEDRGYGDLKDMHSYPGPGMFPVMDDRVSVLGEFGGLGLPVEGHLWWDRRNWGYRTYRTKEELHRNYENLVTRLDALIPEGLAAAVYTQTTDVEGEVNGLMTYDRILKFEPEWLRDQHAKLYEPAGRVVRTVVAATAETGRQEWSYTLEKPADGWEEPEFGAEGWQQGVGGFGTRETPGTIVRTVWDGSEIWVRRAFELDAIPAGELRLRIHHDEDAEVYLNGVEVATLSGYTTEYTDLPLGGKGREALKEGKNVLAIHCRQTQGGQYIDAGLVAVEETDEVATEKTSRTDGAGHRVLLQGNGKLAIVANGKIEWEMPWAGIHDVHVLPNGNIMTQRDMREIVEIDPETKQVVWSYNAATSNGNEGKRIEVHAFQPLEDGRVMIAESGAGRIIEIDREGELRKELALKRDRPDPHRDTRLARKLANGHYLVCHEGDGAVREYDSGGEVVWEYEVPLFGRERAGGHGPEAWGNAVFAAVRLASGNTLIATGNGHSVIEVTPEQEIVWHLKQDDLPAIRLAWVTTLEVLPNGNYMIGNCHAGPDNPLLVEIEPTTKKVVWTLDEFARFGNSVPNSALLDVTGATLR